MTRARLRCAACDRPLRRGNYLLCVFECGARLCRARHIPHCTDLHAGQCPNYEPMEAS